MKQNIIIQFKIHDKKKTRLVTSIFITCRKFTRGENYHVDIIIKLVSDKCSIYKSK